MADKIVAASGNVQVGHLEGSVGLLLELTDGKVVGLRMMPHEARDLKDSLEWAAGEAEDEIAAEGDEG